jgi:hypothetical protein
VGTAGAVQNKQQQKYASQQAAQQSVQAQAHQQGVADAQAQQQAAPVPPPAAPVPAQDDLTAKLQQLAELRSAGMLSDEEFAAAKQKLLAG